MPNPHSFYRFQPAWNAGFYPDNQITSNLLNDLHVAISAWLPAYWPGLTISQLKAGVTQFIQPYNEFPNFGEFVLTLNKIADTPNWEYTINIFNADLAVTDSSQIVTISGFFNPTTQIVVSAAVYSFTVGAYSGSFDASPIPVEAEVANSLTIAEQYGSAMFPLTYLYNPSTNIAKSGLARGKNWTVNTNGDPTRLPVNSQPLLNARRFTLPALTGDEKFIVTFLEKLINSSLVDDSYLSIEADYNSFVMPDGWTKSWTFDAGTYDRIQVSCTDSDSGNVFLIVGRNDAGWLWQRFVRIGGSTPAFDFLGYYSDTTPLPYNSSSASSYLFFDEYYEFDFCDFTEGCYVSPEFYAMPAIPGDTWQFNVPMAEANLTGLTSVNVGIFKEDGGFLHKIGTASKEDACFTQMYASATIPAVATGCYRLGLYTNPNADCSFLFTYSISGLDFGNYIVDVQNIGGSVIPNISFAIVGLASPTYYLMPVTDTTISSDIVTWVNTNIPGMSAISDAESITFSWQVDNLPCGETYFMQNCQSDGSSCINELWQSESQECICLDQEYLYSLSNIINVDASDCFSTMLEYWGNNDSIAEGFEYIGDWKQRVRLGINGGGAKPIIEENLYRQSNGVHKRPQNKQDLSVDLHTDFLDEATQLALVDATRHPYLVWSGKPIFVKGDIEVATTQDFTTQSSFETLSQVKFQALIQGFQPKNSSCLTC